MLPEEMRVRLGARGNSWKEFIDLLAHLRIDEEERKQEKRSAAMKPIQPPPSLRKKLEKERAKKERSPTP